MKKKTIFVCLCGLCSNFFYATTFGQFTHKIKADSVRIYNDNCTAELIVENSTSNIRGFLFNKGAGRTEFRKILIRLNDSSFLIGGDTLTIKPVFNGLQAGSALFYDGTSINQDNNHFFWDNINKRLGIGTNSPLNKFSVVGGGDVASIGSLTQKWYFAPDGSGIGLFSGAGQSEAGIYAENAVGNLRFYANSAERGRITSTGRWLLGTTIDNGFDILQVNGTVNLKGQLTIERSSTTETSIINNEGNLIYNAQNNFNHVFQSNGSEIARILTTGDAVFGNQVTAASFRTSGTIGQITVPGEGSGSVILYGAYSGIPADPGLVVKNHSGTLTFYHNSNGGSTYTSGSMTAASFFGSGTGLTGYSSNFTAQKAYELNTLGSYVWSASGTPSAYNNSLMMSFVGPLEGWTNYGSVITAKSYSGGGGSLQMYVPYSPSYGGTGLQVRFGNYDINNGNSWTSWKTLLASDNYNSYAPTLTGTGASGTWGIGITGNAATATAWGGSAANFSVSMAGNDANGVPAFNVSNGRYEYLTIPNLQAALALGSNAYTSTAYLPLTAGASYPLTGNLLPAINATYDFGSPSLRWATLYSYHGNFNGNMTIGGTLNGTSGTFSSIVTASSFSGAGSGLTGTASSLSIGGNAATATNSTQWNGNIYDGSIAAPSPYLSLLYGTDGKWHPATQSETRTFLGLGSNAYTATSYLPLTAGSGNSLTGDLYLDNKVLRLKTSSSIYRTILSEGSQEDYLNLGLGFNLVNITSQLNVSGTDALGTFNNLRIYGTNRKIEIWNGSAYVDALAFDNGAVAMFRGVSPQSSYFALYSHITAGGFGVMYRDAYDSYITSNMQWNAAGNTIAKYTHSGGIGFMSMTGSTLAWATYNGSVTAGASYTLTDKFVVNGSGDVTANSFSGAGTGLIGYASGLRSNDAYYLTALNNYTQYASALPNDFWLGIQSSFVQPSDGWQSYGTVITTRTYSGGGATLQMYVPYAPSLGGTGLQVRFGNYEASSGNSWTSWKTLLASDNFNSYVPTLAGVGATGTWPINISGSAANSTQWNGITYGSGSSIDTYMLGYAGGGVYYAATAAHIQTFLGLGTAAYVAANQNLNTSSNVQFATIDATLIRSSGDIIAYYSSDPRFKNNMKPISNAVELLGKMGGYSFEWNSQQSTYAAGTKDLGLNAEEIYELFKDLPGVVTIREDGSKAIMYHKTIPILVEAIKELKNEIEKLKTKK